MIDNIANNMEQQEIINISQEIINNSELVLSKCACSVFV